MNVTHAPEQRFDVNGNDVVQFRGNVVDAQVSHPQVVVRFGGQQQAQLYRWATPGKHMSVVGNLDVKLWTDRNGQWQMALLVEARDIHPLNPDVVDHSHAGVHAVMGRTSSELKPRADMAQRAKRMREMLDAG